MDEQKNSVVKAGFWFAVCNIIQKGTMIVSVPIFTRIMSVSDYGLTAIYQSWNNVLIIVVTLSLSLGVFNNGMLHYKDDRNRYISSMQGLSTVSAVLFLVVVFIIRRPVSKIIGLSEEIVILMFISYMFQPSFEYWSARNRYEYKYRGLLIATIIYTILNILIPVTVVLVSSHDLGEKKIIATIWTLIGFTFLFYVYNFYIGKQFYVKKYWKYALCFNLPLIPHYLSTIILNQSDRIMIGKYCGEADAGIYSVACYLQTGIAVIISAVNSAFVPWLYEQLEKKEYELIQKRAEKLIGLLGYICLGFVSCAPEIIKIMAPSVYYGAVWAVPPVVIGSYITVLYIFFGNVEVYHEKTVFMTCATVIAAVTNVILNYIFIPYFGYIVCAYTTLFCYLLYSFAHYVFMNLIRTENGRVRKYHIYDMKRNISIYLVVSLLSVLQAILYQTLLIRYGIMIGISIILYNLWKKGVNKNGKEY